MPLTTRYYFVVSMDVDPDKEALFNEVYDTEHIPELLSVPGMISTTRGKKCEAELSIEGRAMATGVGEPTYTVIYELESPDVIRSPQWGAAIERGRWSSEVRPFTHNRHHVMYEVTSTSP